VIDQGFRAFPPQKPREQKRGGIELLFHKGFSDPSDENEMVTAIPRPDYTGDGTTFTTARDPGNLALNIPD